MVNRPIWMQRLRTAWRAAPIAWLAGPRRIGKTVLAQSLSDIEFLNCDLPSAAERLQDPESFYRSVSKPIVVFDEIHQLPDPSRLLKIGADAFRNLKILATGSSTLAATQKFRDSLTGRKRVVDIVPVLFEELELFGILDIQERLLRGGLPPALLAPKLSQDFFSEWLDSYFARDVQELYHLEKRGNFLKAFELLLRQSGGMLDTSKIAAASEVSRPTMTNWLEVFQATRVINLIRPFSGGGRREVVAQPKVFGFDTGLVCYARGWDRLRSDDCGILWEHMVLDTLIAAGGLKIHFWRDKQQRELDFVVPRGRDSVDTIECKWKSNSFSPDALTVFRSQYPNGRNFVVTPQRSPSFPRVVDKHQLQFVSPIELRKEFSSPETGDN